MISYSSFADELEKIAGVKINLLKKRKTPITWKEAMQEMLNASPRRKKEWARQSKKNLYPDGVKTS